MIFCGTSRFEVPYVTILLVAGDGRLDSRMVAIFQTIFVQYAPLFVFFPSVLVFHIMSLPMQTSMVVDSCVVFVQSGR